MTASKKPGASARPRSAGSGGASGTLGKGGAPRIIPNKRRRLQVAPTGRKLFGKEAQDEFLEWFAATCNTSLAARKAGFHYRTVLRHWREDAEFGARCEETLRIGYVRLDELALRSAQDALGGAEGPTRRRAVKGDRAHPPETLAMTPADALQLLREHKRNLNAGAAGGVGRKQGRRPRIATNAEVREALISRLDAFRDRVLAEDRAGQAGANESREEGPRRCGRPSRPWIGHPWPGR